MLLKSRSSSSFYTRNFASQPWSVGRKSSPLALGRRVSERRSASLCMMSAVRRTLKGVAFDMDGTLTVPVIDFALMRRRAGVLQGDILEEVEKMEPKAQAAARAAIWNVEQLALKDMRLMPGVTELCAFLDRQGIPRGLITRNVKASVDFFHAEHLRKLASLVEFSPALGRECGMLMEPKLRFKPHPDSLLHICRTWGIQPNETMFVGDSPKDDIVCGNRAGAWTVLLDEDGRFQESELHGELKPTFRIRRMSELIQLLQTEFDLQPPADAGNKVVVQPAAASA